MIVATEATAEPSISPYCLALVSLGAIRLPLSAKKKEYLCELSEVVITNLYCLFYTF